MDLNILKLTHRAFKDSLFPKYLAPSLHSIDAYNLRSSAPVLTLPRESGTFEHTAAAAFNKLPAAMRNITDYNTFCRSVKEQLRSDLTTM